MESFYDLVKRHKEGLDKYNLQKIAFLDDYLSKGGSNNLLDRSFSMSPDKKPDLIESSKNKMTRATKKILVASRLSG